MTSTKPSGPDKQLIHSQEETKEILSEQYNVSVAKSGIQALNLLKRNIIPDLILLDIDMPHIDGYETLEKIKKINGCDSIPIIFLTGFSEMDYEIKGLTIRFSR